MVWTLSPDKQWWGHPLPEKQSRWYITKFENDRVYYFQSIDKKKATIILTESRKRAHKFLSKNECETYIADHLPQYSVNNIIEFPC